MLMKRHAECNDIQIGDVVFVASMLKGGTLETMYCTDRYVKQRTLIK